MMGLNSVGQAREGERVESAPVVRKSPGASRLRNQTRAKMLEALDVALKAVEQDKARGGYAAHKESLLRMVLASLSGWLESQEPEIAAKFWKLLEDATA